MFYYDPLSSKVCRNTVPMVPVSDKVYPFIQDSRTDNTPVIERTEISRDWWEEGVTQIRVLLGPIWRSTSKRSKMPGKYDASKINITAGIISRIPEPGTYTFSEYLDELGNIFEMPSSVQRILWTGNGKMITAFKDLINGGDYVLSGKIKHGIKCVPIVYLSGHVLDSTQTHVMIKWQEDSSSNEFKLSNPQIQWQDVRARNYNNVKEQEPIIAVLYNDFEIPNDEQLRKSFVCTNENGKRLLANEILHPDCHDVCVIIQVCEK